MRAGLEGKGINEKRWSPSSKLRRKLQEPLNLTLKGTARKTTSCHLPARLLPGEQAREQPAVRRGKERLRESSGPVLGKRELTVNTLLSSGNFGPWMKMFKWQIVSLQENYICFQQREVCFPKQFSSQWKNVNNDKVQDREYDFSLAQNCVLATLIRTL